jgi:hypothetical protein
MIKKALFIQPGKLGDLIVTSPIAKAYHEKGYEVHWPVFDNFKNYFNAFEHVNSFTVGAKMDSYAYYRNQRIDSVSLNVFVDAGTTFFKNLNKWLQNHKNPESFEIVDFCFTFPGHTNNHNNHMTKIFMDENKNWIDLKYHLANIPLKIRWDFSWKRDQEKEEKLHKFIVEYAKNKYNSEKYSIVHNYKGGRQLTEIEVENPINFSYIKGYEIYDWFKVLLNAQSITCIDSCLAHFVDVVPEFKNIEKYYLGCEQMHFHAYMRNILLNNWINHSDSDITYNDFKL